MLTYETRESQPWPWIVCQWVLTFLNSQITEAF